MQFLNLNCLNSHLKAIRKANKVKEEETTHAREDVGVSGNARWQRGVEHSKDISQKLQQTVMPTTNGYAWLSISYLDTFSYKLQVHSGRGGAGFESRVLHMSGDL